MVAFGKLPDLALPNISLEAGDNRLSGQMEFPEAIQPMQDDSKMSQEFCWRLEETSAALMSISEADASPAVALCLFYMGCLKEDLSLEVFG